MAKSFTLKLKKSLIGCDPAQRATIKGLGLRKLGTEVTVKDSSPIRGMIFKVQHLLDVKVSK